MPSEENSNRIGQIVAFSTLLSVLITLIFGIFFKSWQQGVIASLIMTAILILVEFRYSLESERINSKSTLLTAADKIVTLLRVHNEYFHEIGMFEMLNTIIRLRENAKRRTHDLVRFDNIISQAIERAEQEIGQAFSITTGDDELGRSIRLKDAINNAESYIYALTYDANSYLNRFWTGNFGREYIESNLKASERGVEIKRIFIVDESIISGSNLSAPDSRKRERLVNMSKALQQGKSSCRVFWAAKNAIPKSLNDSNTSFLISDDYVGSESNGIHQGNNILGYVSYGDRSGVIEPLKDRFERLLRYADEIPKNLE